MDIKIFVLISNNNCMCHACLFFQNFLNYLKGGILKGNRHIFSFLFYLLFLAPQKIPISEKKEEKEEAGEKKEEKKRRTMKRRGGRGGKRRVAGGR